MSPWQCMGVAVAMKICYVYLIAPRVTPVELTSKCDPSTSEMTNKRLTRFAEDLAPYVYGVKSFRHPCNLSPQRWMLHVGIWYGR
jgi:hypothetical protein